MLPVTHGVERTRREVLRYALATWVVSLIPALLTGDLVYGSVAWVAGAWYAGMARRLKRLPMGPGMDRYARRVFVASISYLMLLFAALLMGTVARRFNLA